MTKTNEKGVYYRVPKNSDDKVYYITYKDNENKKVWLKIGKHSEGVRIAYCRNMRIDILSKQRLGEKLPNVAIRSAGKKGILFKEVWLYYVNNKAMANSTKKNIVVMWDKHFKNYFGRAITLEKIKKFKKDKLLTLTPATVSGLINYLNTSINFWNIKNPSKKIHNIIKDYKAEDRLEPLTQEKTDRNRKRERYLSKEEINLLMDELEWYHEDLKLFVMISLSTGARLGTVLSIKKKDIKGNTVLLINHKVGGKRYTGFLNNDVMQLLDERLKYLEADDKIFTLKRRNLQDQLLKIFKRLFNKGIDRRDIANRVVIHTLRHTFASHLVMKGVPIVKVSKLLNHSNIETTMRYSHLAPDAGADDVMSLWE